MQEVTKQLKELLQHIQSAMGKLDIEADRQELAKLNKQIQSPNFWDDAQAAAAVSQQAAGLKKHVEEWSALESEAEEALELARLEDTSLQAEIEDTCKRLEAEYRRRELELKLAGPYDKNGAILSIFAGTGGTDAQDWSEMLLRMYLRYVERAGFSAAILDQSPGEEAGIKSVTVEVTGAFAYGRLKSEKGVHRLVRLSPFNADHLRQTSFALVDVMPLLAPAQQLEIDPSELRVDVYRSGGHGGQSVNTTDSAVRLTHLPTGITVAIQNERSQLQNKEKAMAILQSRLAALMLEQHKAKLSEIRGETSNAAWGNQIRSYVLHPYNKVKDHRTGAETSQTGAVLDGDLELFVDAFLREGMGASSS